MSAFLFGQTMVQSTIMLSSTKEQKLKSVPIHRFMLIQLIKLVISTL